MLEGGVEGDKGEKNGTLYNSIINKIYLKKSKTSTRALSFYYVPDI